MTDKTWSRVSDAFNRASAYIHRKGGYKAEYLTDKEVKPLIDETYNAFSEAVDYGLKDNEIPTAMRMYLQDNVFVFSGFKTHTELRQASALLRDASGQIKPFNRFLSDIQKIDKDYNKTYLQAEYNFAVASSQAAARWQEFAADGDDFLLQYRTAKDEKVREQHRILDGITLPPSDKFWDEYFVPLGWNCRCSVVQVNPKRYPESNSEEAIQRGRAATYQPNAKGQNKAQIFRFNSGKQKVVFPPKHPYYPKNCGDCKYRKLAYDKDNLTCRACKEIENLLKRENEYIDIPTNKGSVKLSRRQNDNEINKNTRTAIYLAETYGYNIELLGTDNTGIKADSFNKTLNRLEEYKVPNTISKSSIDNAVRSGAEQADNIVLNLSDAAKNKNNGNLSEADIRRYVINRMRDKQNVENVFVLTETKDFLITRKDINKPKATK